MKEEERHRGSGGREGKRKSEKDRKEEQEREREGETRGEASNSLVFISVVSRFLRPPPIPCSTTRPLFLSIPPKKNSH